MADINVMIRRLIKAAVELAVVRGNLVKEDEDERAEFDMDELTSDIASAAFGIDTCEGSPIPEVLNLQIAWNSRKSTV